ncbi:MAG: peptide chain release factor N(5)-glutamine methyltransferase [Candidatus Moranbacteria bacterium]|nr:peptide chain release factor N(5)-glutamine methyltransferase [Candidatus Moranbacteria bacterium]
MTTLHELKKTFLPALAPEDFFILLAEATGKEKVFLLAHPEYELSTKEQEKAAQYLERRLKHESVASIVGHKEFYGREFRVTKDTLIPRPETELLIERLLYKIATEQETTNGMVDIIDIGTGSGNIIITLARETKILLPKNHIRFFALDISSAALTVAEKNATIQHVKESVTFLHSDLLKNFSPSPEKNRHCVIAANLPYLSIEIYNASDPDVRDYEPKSALVSGHDGLDHYRRLLKELRKLLTRYISLTVFFEISPEQSTLLKEIIQENFPQASLTLFQDLTGRDRLIQATIKL